MCVVDDKRDFSTQSHMRYYYFNIFLLHFIFHGTVEDAPLLKFEKRIPKNIHTYILSNTKIIFDCFVIILISRKRKLFSEFPHSFKT